MWHAHDARANLGSASALVIAGAHLYTACTHLNATEVGGAECFKQSIKRHSLLVKIKTGRGPLRMNNTLSLRDAGAFVEHVVAPVNYIIVPLIIENGRRAVKIDHRPRVSDFAANSVDFCLHLAPAKAPRPEDGTAGILVLANRQAALEEPRSPKPKSNSD